MTNLVQFNVVDMRSPQLVVGNTFHDAAEFRKVVKQANIIKGKDLTFKKNEMKRIVIVCKDSRYKYRVYGRQLKDELTSILVS